MFSFLDFFTVLVGGGHFVFLLFRWRLSRSKQEEKQNKPEPSLTLHENPQKDKKFRIYLTKKK